jgi:hypothetical protein
MGSNRCMRVPLLRRQSTFVFIPLDTPKRQCSSYPSTTSTTCDTRTENPWTFILTHHSTTVTP